jgi:hypothetical protein
MTRTLADLERNRDHLSRNWQAAYDRRVRMGLPTNDENLNYLGSLVDAAVHAVTNFDRYANQRWTPETARQRVGGTWGT